MNYILIWLLAGSVLSNLMWAAQDLRLRGLAGEKKSSNHYANIYTRGIIMGFILGPLAIFPLFSQCKKIDAELDEFNKGKDETSN